eukprot:977641-Amphidinium_carterae.1
MFCKTCCCWCHTAKGDYAAVRCAGTAKLGCNRVAVLLWDAGPKDLQVSGAHSSSGAKLTQKTKEQ